MSDKKQDTKDRSSDMSPCQRCGHPTRKSGLKARAGRPLFCRDCRSADTGLIQKWSAA